MRRFTGYMILSAVALLAYAAHAQEWAVDVGLAAGMEVHGRGYLALRHMRPPMPYLPSGHFL